MPRLNRVAVSMPLPEGDLPEWIHLVPFGEWLGHRAGAFRVGRVEAEEMLRNFADRRAAGGHDLVVDYEHQTYYAEQNGKPAPAAGWIDELELRGDGIWGHVREWTQRAATAISQREYRYISPVITPRGVHWRTGEPCGAVLDCAALTNLPFMRELTPITLSSRGDLMHPLLIFLLSALGLPETADQAAVEAALTERRQTRAATCRAAGLPETCTETELRAALDTTATHATLGRVACRALNWTDVPADSAARLERELRHTGYVPFADFAAAQAAASSQAAANDETILATALAEGKIAPGAKDHFKKWLASDRTAALAFLNSQPRGSTVPVVPQAGSGGQGGGASTPALDDDDRVFCSQWGVDPAKYLERRQAAERGGRAF